MAKEIRSPADVRTEEIDFERLHRLPNGEIYRHAKPGAERADNVPWTEQDKRREATLQAKAQAGLLDDETLKQYAAENFSK